jgi:hypothetical protein
MDRITVEVNGVQHIISNTSPKTSLNEWLRSQPGLKGKEHIAILGVRADCLFGGRLSVGRAPVCWALRASDSNVSYIFTVLHNGQSCTRSFDIFVTV